MKSVQKYKDCSHVFQTGTVGKTAVIVEKSAVTVEKPAVIVEKPAEKRFNNCFEISLKYKYPQEYLLKT